jgi:uncharacterized protein involved in exopolysaccharide biosynthesis
MSNEIDLSLFIAALRRRWWIILICVAIALAAGLGIGLAQDRRYEASSVLLVQSPRYQWRFVTEITAITDLRRDFQREILAIARSDEIAQAAATAWQAGGAAEAVTAEMLKSAVAVRAGDGNTIVIAATADDPEQAAAYASAWRRALMDTARNTYGAEEDLASFQAELQAIEAQLQASEAALANSRARTGLYDNSNLAGEMMGSSLKHQQLNQIDETLAEYLAALRNLRLLQGGLAQAPSQTDLAELPWELLAGPVLTQRGVISPESALASLNDTAQLLNLLRQEERALQATADALAQEADQLRAALAADWQEFETTVRQRDQAQDTYRVLSEKIAELSLQERIDPSLLTIVGSPEPLVAHVRAPMLGLLASAAVAGLIVGVFLAVWLELSRRKRSPTPAPALSQ